MSPWRAQLACPPRAAGPRSNQGRQEAKSGSGSPPPAWPQQVVPGSLLCFLGPIHAEASGGRWALCHVLHAGAPPLARVHADPLGPTWGRAAGALPTLARSSQDLLALPWATWICVCVCLPSLQWNFIQAGAAKALGQALQLNTSLTSLE